MPPEKSAYALARYSRSPDSILQSVEWVRTHDSRKFLESFYFQYGHASIADLGHLAVCLEGVSELAATEIEDEQLWDGQAKSTRYQDFSKSGFVVPPDFDAAQAAAYTRTGAGLIESYLKVHDAVFAHLTEQLPRPAEMKQDAYERNLTARSFDVARYLLFFGIPTNAGQVVSIRTLERQIRRLKASEYAEVRSIAEEMTQACAEPAACQWDQNAAAEPLVPTLAKYVDPDVHRGQARADLTVWAEQNLPPAAPEELPRVDLLRPLDNITEIAATLLYPVTDRSYRDLQRTVASWSTARRMEVIETALRSRTRRDELMREFRSAPYIFDIVMDIGAYRDLHRHRRCQQLRQAYSGNLGYDTPAAVDAAGIGEIYHAAMRSAFEAMKSLPRPGAHYLLPFGAFSRFLFKMDFAEVEYISRLRSGVKGHFSYRQVAWDMKQRMDELEPELGRLIEATPPWVEDPLTR
ncbi:MAG: FAD-dependent thymidylate synthase [Candidatus Solibacter usitatus]|nr:FAD-dependent thymidylate synthase [Candidatus Solibacter usitatus]